MTYQKRCNTKDGLVLVDVLLALALAALFVGIITQSTLMSRSIFESAKERNLILDIYEAHASLFTDMVPYERRLKIIESDESFGATTTIDAYAHWYGNERVQTDIVISAGEQTVMFAAVEAHPLLDKGAAAGMPLCSVDLSSNDIVGSYGFFRRQNRFASSGDAQPLIPKIVPITLPIDPLLPLTDIQVRNGMAYLTADSSRASDPDLIIASIRDPNIPDLYVDVNTGPGFAGLALAANRVYAAMTSRTAQLQIFRIAPYISGINVENSYKLPLPYATATPPLGSAIFYDKGIVYVGTEKWDGEEFNVIDVSDPARPLRLGALEIGSKVNAIFVREGTAYVAASDENQLHVIDVRNPSAPALVDEFSPSGWERQEGKSFWFFEDELSLGRTSGGFNIKQDHELFAWGTSTISRLDAVKSLDVPGGIYGIVKDRSHVFAATRQYDREVQIFDSALSTTTATSFSLPVAPQTMTCDGDYLYVLAATAPVIYQISFK